MNLPILGNVVIINNLRTEDPNTVDDVEVLDAALRTVGFNVKIHNDCTVQVRVHYLPQRSCSQRGVWHTPPLGRYIPPATPSDSYTSGRYTSWQPYPPSSRYIPPPVTAVDGTHPTGMFSCSPSIYIVQGLGRGAGYQKISYPDSVFEMSKFTFTFNTFFKTRMHSGRMRTARLLTVSHSKPCI